MNIYRIWHTIRLCMQRSAFDRANYLRDKKIFHHVGNDCSVMFRKVPLYPQLISFGDNVRVATNVTFVTHDVINYMLNFSKKTTDLPENIGCIEIKDNVFIGANSTILSNVTIGSNTIIAAGSLVNKSIPGNGVYGGVPARIISPLDEFIEKRKNLDTPPVKKIKGNLTKETIEKYWERHSNMYSVFTEKN